MNNIKVGTLVHGVYSGSQKGAMQFVCAYRSGSVVWFLGTDYTVGTPAYSNNYTCKVLNNNSLNWSDACACSWTIYLYNKSGTITVENCKIPTYTEVNTMNYRIRAIGFPYWTSTKIDNSQVQRVSAEGNIYADATSNLDYGVVPLAKINL